MSKSVEEILEESRVEIGTWPVLNFNELTAVEDENGVVYLQNQKGYLQNQKGITVVMMSGADWQSFVQYKERDE